MKKLLLIGSTGAIGRAIQLSLERFQAQATLEVLLTSRVSRTSSSNYLNLLDSSSKWPNLERCDFIVVAAGLGDLKTCHEFPEETRKVNVESIGEIARKYLAEGGRLAYLSSTQVFSGEQAFVHFDTKRRPRTELGRQKHEAELVVQDLGGLVVRPGKVLREY